LCDCIEILREQIREDTGDPEAHLVLGFSFNEGNVKVYTPVTFMYRKKKKDGSFGRKVEGSVFGAYCPICGTKLDEEAKIK
jgi:hypothetical protein